MRKAAAALLVFSLAGGSAAFARHFEFQVFGQEAGLTDLDVHCVIQDKAGFLWAGTQYGLFRFDGQRFERYTVAQGLPDNVIWSLLETSGGTLVVGTSRGLALRAGMRFSAVAGTGLWNFDGAQSLAEGPGGEIYASTTKGLWRGAPASSGGLKFSLVHQPPVFAVLVHQSALWFGCGSAICELDDGRVIVFGPDNGVPEDHWHSIVSDGSARIWARGNNHLLSRAPGAAGFADEGLGLEPSVQRARLLVDRHGELLVSTRRGMARRRNREWEYIGRREGLPVNQVQCLYQDREGSIWIGTMGGGLSRWIGYEQWTAWTEADGLVSDMVWGIASDARGGAWVGTDAGLVHVARDGRVLATPVAENQGTVARARDGTIWLSNSRNLSALDSSGRRLRRYGAADGISGTTSSTLFVDGENRIWVAGGNTLFRSKAGNGPIRFEPLPAIPIGGLNRLHQAVSDEAGGAWITTSTGLWHFRQGQWTRLSKADGLLDDWVNHVQLAGRDRLFVAYARGRGVTEIRWSGNGPAFRHFSTADGLRSDMVYFIGWTGERLWVGTDSGVCIFDGTRWEHFDRTDGLVWDDTNSDSFLAGEDGCYWVGTSRGLARYCSVPQQPLPVPPVVITSIAAAGSQWASGEPAALPYNDRLIWFRFAGLSFSRPSAVNYRYRLTGLTQRWVEQQGNEVQFQALAPGDYRFEVEARRDNAEWSGQPAVYSFSVAAPWWRGPAALAVFTVLVVLAVWRFWTWLIQAYVRRQRELEEKVAQRTADIERLLKVAEQASKAKTEFLANMSHEIRTPMNAVLGLTSLVMDMDLPSEAKELLGTVRMSGDSLLAIINEILDYSKIEAGQLELEEHRFDLYECVEEALALCAHAAFSKHIELVSDCHADVPQFVVGDATRLRQVLVNLAGNAVKFTDRGEVGVEVRLLESPQAARAAPNDGKNSKDLAAASESVVGEVLRRPDRTITLAFEVWDTGPGIPADRQSRLFRSFSQADSSTSRKFGGTGLGLAISKRLAEAMGGSIRVESQEGFGSRFIFSIKVREASSEGGDPAAGPYVGHTALIVDDNQTSRGLLQKRLGQLGVRTVAAASAAEALRMVGADNAERFSFAIVDFCMPEMDGVELAHRLHAVGFDCPLLLLVSGVADHQQTDGVFLATASKPVRSRRLAEMVAAALATAEAPASAHRDIGSVRRVDRQYPLKILVAEDNVVNQRVVVRHLERLGYRPDVVANGKEVLTSMGQRAYDVILMDVQMPELDGRQATAQIRARMGTDRRPWIIALTAGAFSDDRLLCRQAGMNDYLAKPFRPEELAEALQRAFTEIDASTAK
jgi:signal transduction histidine kinase/DNA-binding response OmpR family regulator/ligand-binding sensor domain-containing protein